MLNASAWGIGYRGALITLLECIKRGVEKAKAQEAAKKAARVVGVLLVFIASSCKQLQVPCLGEESVTCETDCVVVCRTRPEETTVFRWDDSCTPKCERHP